MVHDGWRVVWQMAQTARDHQGHSRCRQQTRPTGRLPATPLPHETGAPPPTSVPRHMHTRSASHDAWGQQHTGRCAQSARFHDCTSTQAGNTPARSKPQQPAKYLNWRACLPCPHSNTTQRCSSQAQFGPQKGGFSNWRPAENAQASTHTQHASICCCCPHKHCTQRDSKTQPSAEDTQHMGRSMLNSRSSDAGSVIPQRQHNSMQAWLCQGRAAQNFGNPDAQASHLHRCRVHHATWAPDSNTQLCPRCRTALL